MKVSANSFQFGEPTSVTEVEHFQEDVVAKTQDKFNLDILRLAFTIIDLQMTIVVATN